MSDTASGTADPVGSTLYERVGGSSFFVALVERFYQEVERGPILRPLYPADLRPGMANLAAFLVQYWGGPADYTFPRGHPRLRMRHHAFAIGPRERNAWVEHMAAAVKSSGAAPADADELITYFQDASAMLINRPAR